MDVKRAKLPRFCALLRVGNRATTQCGRFEESFPARIKQALTNWRTGFPTLISDRETNLVEGTPTNGGTANLFFDVETGLLVRLVRFSNSPVGRVVARVD